MGKRESSESRLQAAGCYSFINAEKFYDHLHATAPPPEGGTPNLENFAL